MNINEYEWNPELTASYPVQSGEYETAIVGELMGVSNELELEQFLGNLWSRIVSAAKSPQAQAVKRDFISGAKQLGSKMVSSIGKNAGSAISGARGEKYGGQMGDALAGWLFGEEAEAVDYARIIGKTIRYLDRALKQGTSTPPRALVTNAINVAARPVLQNNRVLPPSRNGEQRGRWIRRGNSVVLLGV